MQETQNAQNNIEKEQIWRTGGLISKVITQIQ